MVDTNHDNSGKQYLEQVRIVRETLLNRDWNEKIKQCVRGFMIESRPPVRISVSEVTASDDGNGYTIAAYLYKTQMTTIDAQGNDITSPKSQIRKPIIVFMTQGTDGAWRASQEDSGIPNTCSVN